MLKGWATRSQWPSSVEVSSGIGEHLWCLNESETILHAGETAKWVKYLLFEHKAQNLNL